MKSYIEEEKSCLYLISLFDKKQMKQTKNKDSLFEILDIK